MTTQTRDTSTGLFLIFAASYAWRLAKLAVVIHFVVKYW